MEKVFSAIGVLLIGFAVVAIALYGWHRQWGAVFFAVAVVSGGRLALGLVEILFLPMTLPAIALAKRGQNVLSFCFMAVSSLATKMAYATFCIAILVYFMRIPGPPSWLVVVLSILLAGAPFAWADQRATGADHPKFDTLAAMLGVLASGVLLLFGVPPLFALIPMVGLFLISAIMHIAWWQSTGMQRIRYAALIDGSA